MKEQQAQGIKEYLQDKDVQERIQKSMQDARAKATVTISQASNLFGFSESQLREWEKRGLLNTKRSALSPDSRGHRQYTSDELDKLAVIRELINAKFTPSDILQEIDEVWELRSNDQQNHKIQKGTEHTQQKRPPTTVHIPIDQRVDYAEKEVFWRYFTSQVLRLSLMLICESIPDTVAGLVLPLRPNASTSIVLDPHHLPDVGESLVGWLAINGSFNTFLDSTPSFEVASDFRIQQLAATEEDVPQDNTLIVVQRKAKPLKLSASVVETIRSLLKPVYENIGHWRSTFDYGMRDWLYQATDLTSSVNPTDEVLDELANMIIQIGGKTSHQQDRRSFCCLLLPDDDTLPLQQRKLLVRAQSERSPYKVGVNPVSSEYPGLSLRAYQSGYVIYRPDMSIKDFIIAYQDQEQSTRSAIALPIAGEDGLSIAVLYVASNEANAFPIEEQRVLRMICKMTEELLMTYSARRKTTGNLSDLIEFPGVVDSSFKNFQSENDFIKDVETLLMDIDRKEESEYGLEEVSFIAIDIDKQSITATKYGDRVARNLSREVGSRLLGHLDAFFTNSRHRRLYHVNADRYYLLLKGMSLEEARVKAEEIRVALEGEYSIDAQHARVGRPTLPEGMLKLPDVTVRLGVPAYKYKKLKEILGRYSKETAVFEAREIITKAIDQVLKQGQKEGGNVIICWDYEAWGYRKWTPSKVVKPE
jgi:DNA-binding transcriptional MerR regulator/GGDEF domain-containing protein